MPFAIVSLFIILVSLAVAAVIVVRKFPKIAALDVEDLPEEKTQRKKREILDRRAAEKVSALVRQIQARARELPLREMGERLVHHARRTAAIVEERYNKIVEEQQKKRAQKMDDGELSETIDARLRKAVQMLDEDRYEDAEAVYIDVIRMDNQHAGAYRGLGKTYMRAGQHEQAEQTFTFLLKLTPEDDTLYVKLAQNAAEAGDRTRAIDYYEQGIAKNPGVPLRFFEVAELYREDGRQEDALAAYESAAELEPGNPRYIDGALNMAILMGKVKDAREWLRELKKANPENQKIEEFEERIKAIR